MLDRLGIYDALYLLASGDGREETLFGSCQPLAREAFSRSLVGDEFPAVWFEVPLSGESRFDLHVAISRAALHPGVEVADGVGNGYDALLRWYAEEEPGGNGIAFAYDVSEGSVDTPAVHVNVNGAPLSDMGRFFELAADKNAAGQPKGASSQPLAAWAHYRAFEARLPRGWHVWYAGVHPGRPGAPVRVDCFVDEELKAAYASAPSLMEAHLRECGFTATSAALRDLAGIVAVSPFALELQFDVLEGGAIGPTIGVSAGFPMGPASRMRPLFEDGGAAAELLGQIEGCGLADGRWRHIPGTVYTGIVERGETVLALYDVPTFVKLRVRGGEPLDAKAYLQAGAQVLGNGTRDGDMHSRV